MRLGKYCSPNAPYRPYANRTAQHSKPFHFCSIDLCLVDADRFVADAQFCCIAEISHRSHPGEYTLLEAQAPPSCLNKNIHGMEGTNAEGESFMTAPLQGVQPQTIYYEDMTVGQKESFTHTVSEEDISAFADLTGDKNPIHIDKAYGEASRFGGNIAHGMYTASLFSAILGMRLPGPGAIYISQSLQFKAPVRPGDAVTVSATVRSKEDKGRRVTLDCSAEVDGLIVLSGEATVMAPKKPSV